MAPRRGRRVAVAAALLPGLVSSALDPYLEARAYAEAHPGCFFPNFGFEPELPGGKRSAEDLLTCQKLCVADGNCTAFTYAPQTRDCSFAGEAAKRKPIAASTVAGYGSCRGRHGANSDACTRAVPENGFPGLTPEKSNAAWMNSYQPHSLECWPMDFAGNYRSCDVVRVLEDTAKGWPGKCIGLIKQEGVLGTEACEQLCTQDPQCPGWQVGYYDWCYHGVGLECFVRSNFTPAASQRLQHGEVRKLMDLAGWQIMGLTRQFVDNKGYFQDQLDAIAACRKVCYSDIHCQYWQYAPKFGCWIEDWGKGYGPAYPLTLDWASRTTAFALDSVAGEMIQHFCPAGHSERTVQVSCQTRGVKYVASPGSWSDERVAQSPAECQVECSKVAQCAFFTFSGKGMCRLCDKTALRMQAMDQDVASGPQVCADVGAPFATVGETQDEPVAATAVPAVTHDAPPGDGRPMMYFVKFNYLVKHMEYLDLGPNHLSNMKLRYAETLAEELGVHPNAVMPTPDGPMSAVELGDGPLDSTTITAYVMNTPPGPNTTNFEKIAVSPGTVAKLQATTAKCIHLGNIAVTGLVVVEARPASRVARPVPEEAASTWASWWPLLLLLLLICIVVAVVGGLTTDICRGSRARDVDLGNDSDVEPVGFAGLAWQQGHASGHRGGSPGRRGVMSKARSKVHELEKKFHLPSPGHRQGDFTV